MEWIIENWFWILVFVGFLALHLFGHGGHRSHSGPGGCHPGHEGEGSREGSEPQAGQPNEGSHAH